MSRRDVAFLAEVIRTLIAATQVGVARGNKETAEKLRKLARGCQALRFKRLYWILEALAVRLGRPDPEIGGSALEELGRLLADARYTAKALKSHLTSQLEDSRLLDDLIGAGWPKEQIEVMRSKTLVTVDDRAHVEGSVWFRTAQLLDPDLGELYGFREHRKVVEGSLDAAPTELGDAALVLEGTVVPSFSPRHLRVESVQATSVPEGSLREHLERRVPDSVGALLAAFRTLREEYLAPRTAPVTLRPARVDAEAVEDRHGNRLPWLRDARTYPEVEGLLFELRHSLSDPWAIHGRLVFVDGAFWLHPLSVLEPQAEVPVRRL